MAYLDDEEDGGPRNLVSNLTRFLVVAAVIMVVRYITTGDIFGWGSSGWTPERVDRELQANPVAGEVYRAVKSSYPSEYQAFVRRMSTVASTGNSAAMETEAFNFTRQLMISHFDGFSRAPSGQIVEVARQYSLLVGALQRTDVNLCAQLVTGGLTPGARPPREAMTILNRIGSMQIQAARAGEARSPSDSRTALSTQEAATFFGEIERRSPSSSRLLADEGALASAPPDQQCAAGLAIYESVGSLPADAAAKVTVSLLRDSFEPAGTTSR